MRLTKGHVCLLFLSAVYAPGLAQPGCGYNPDYNGDLTIGTADLLSILNLWSESDSDADGIWDSQDDCVGVRDACGVCNGSGLDVDSDSVCDDVDPCVGALDVCGVCNGPGPTVPVIDEIVFVTDSLFVPPLGTWYVFSYAVDTLYTYVCPVQGCMDANAWNYNPLAVVEDGSCTYGPAQCGGVSTVTFDGHTYALVAIGTQCWFAENLRSDNYRNGDAIPGNLNGAHWRSAPSGAQTVYGEGTSPVFGGSSDEVANLATYGRLFNWSAVNDSRGLCPSGYHVPSDGEWTALENSLGGSSVAGMALKASSPTWDGTNSSGFSALPGGMRDVGTGDFHNLGAYGNWWSSSSNGTNAFWRTLGSGESAVFRAAIDKRNGNSVRCIRDSESGVCFDPDGDDVCAENEVSGCTDSAASNFSPEATEEDFSCEFPGPIQCGGQSTVTFYGHMYDLVAIGTQCWFAENLRSDSYSNGDAILGELDNQDWSSISLGAQAVYNNNSGSLDAYGRLYNWYAVNDSRGLCPSGFHVPSDAEWTTLEDALGGSAVAGAHLKASSPSWDGTNSSGFKALPGGYRYAWYGDYIGEGYEGFWWTSSPSHQAYHSWFRGLSSDQYPIGRHISVSMSGFSVRCVRD